MKLPLFHSCLFAAAAAGILAVAPAQGQTLVYPVNINVASLVAATNGAPYSLDFQLNGSSGLTNTATISNFTFTTGAPSGSATTTGAVTGDLSTSVTLSLGSANSYTAAEFYQAFTGTTTDISFNVSTTENSSGITPDSFLIAILDNTNSQLYTTAPDGASLVTESINGTSTSGPAAYESTAPSPLGVIATVPEPGTVGAVVVGMGGLLLAYRRKRS